MALAMGNQPITSVVSTTGLQWNFMAYIPLLSGDHLHAAQMTDATVPHENVSPHLCCDAYPLH
jgi:hypothetical protein